jgi:hypothetical protein
MGMTADVYRGRAVRAEGSGIPGQAVLPGIWARGTMDMTADIYRGRSALTGDSDSWRHMGRGH